MKLLGRLVDIISLGMAAERKSAAGRVNVFGLVLVAIVALANSVTPWFEALVRVFRPDYAASTTSLLQILIFFGVFVLACVWMLGLLERDEE